jgi:hypothetical protein
MLPNLQRIINCNGRVISWWYNVALTYKPITTPHRRCILLILKRRWSYYQLDHLFGNHKEMLQVALRYGTKSCVMLIVRQYNVHHNRRSRWFVVSEQGATILLWLCVWEGKMKSISKGRCENHNN